MAYENNSAAYNLDLFRDNTAKELPKEKQNKTKVVSLPQDALIKIRRRKHNPFRLFIGAVSAAMIILVVSVIIIGQVQLTELNQKIINTKEELSNARSTYTQSQMAIQSNLSTNQIEEYAVGKLGMTKAENAQKEYVSLSEGDKAEISEDANQNFFQKIINAFTGLWS